MQQAMVSRNYRCIIEVLKGEFFVNCKITDDFTNRLSKLVYNQAKLFQNVLLLTANLHVQEIDARDQGRPVDQYMLKACRFCDCVAVPYLMAKTVVEHPGNFGFG